MAPSRKRLTTAFGIALVATSIGSTLLPLGLSRLLHGSVIAGVALNLWAFLLFFGICFITLVFPPEFGYLHFRLAMTLGFVFNVVALTGVIYGVGRFVTRFRRARYEVPAKPA